VNRFLVFLAVMAIFGIGRSPGQAPDVPKTWIAIAQLSPPVYPALARQARIMGEVKIRLVIRKDGTIVSAEVVSGHPMLKEAALKSAQATTFRCENCTEETTEYVLTYTFGLRTDGRCGVARKLRAGKCFYLWHCGRWESEPSRPPVFGETKDGVVILADAACLEIMESRASR